MAKATKVTTTRTTRSGATKKDTKSDSKVIKKVTKTAKATKVATTKATTKTPKAPVPPKVKATKKTQAKETKAATNDKLLEVCLLLDCTGSMSSWIQRSKDTLKGIIKSVQEDYAGLKVLVSFVGYRDVQDHPRFEIFEFSDDLDAATAFIAKMQATGGGDTPEDVQGGL